MTNYIQVNITFSPCEEMFTDVAASLLGEIGYESFTASENGMVAYVTENEFDEAQIKVALLELPFETKTSYTFQTVLSQNWNEEWEKNYFEPIVIENECVIHSSFHKNTPIARYDILIDPKMSFGTGHHETTSQMLEQLLQMDVTGKSLLDMGCGTAVLAILAHKKGANPIDAIDIDEWACNNSTENIVLNETSNINVLLGGAELIENNSYDVILANINRNILLNDIHHYADSLLTSGFLVMSGFYTEDMPMIREEAERKKLTYVSHTVKNNWVAIKFSKK